MKITLRTSVTLVAALVAVASLSYAQEYRSGLRGQAAVYPWSFDKGTDTARRTVYEAAEGIAGKAGYAVIPRHVAEEAWESLRFPDPESGRMPSDNELRMFARRVNADVVLFGSTRWHTRSIWVGLGPKTVSTSMVDVYVYDAARDRVTYSVRDMKGRSDERENGYKIAADILVTPVVSAVSGGPATPREQRAVQIALARAYYSWVRPRE